MDTGLIIGITFVIMILAQGVILLKNLKDERNSKNILNLFFRFISNSSLYIVALLIFINATDAKNLASINFNDLQGITLEKIAILIMLFIDLTVVLAVIYNLITQTTKQKEVSSINMIDQNKAKQI